MKAFLKENAVLVAGIALPLILTIIFFVLTQMDQKLITPPDHAVLYTTNDNYNAYYKVFIKDEKAYLSIKPVPETATHYQDKLPELYLFDARNNETTAINLPKFKKSKKVQEILIDDLKDRRFSNKSISPDGFSFTYSYHRNGNLMTEMFGGGYRSRSQYVLVKDRKEIKVPNSRRYNSRFIGWTIE